MGIKLSLKEGSAVKKVIRLSCLFILIVSFPIAIISNKLYLIPIVFLYCCTCILTMQLEEHICLSILSVYTLLAGPIHMLVAEISPLSVFGPGMFYEKRGLLESSYLHWQYTGLTICFHLLLVILFFVCDKIFIVNKTKPIRITHFVSSIGDVFNGKPIRKYVTIALYAGGEFFLRITFNLNVPGKHPVIPFAGVIVYLISFFHQLIAYMCLCSFYHKKRICISTIVCLIFDYCLLSIPDLLLDRRAPLFFLVIIAFLHMYFWEKEAFNAFLEKRKVFFVILIVISLVFFQKFSEKVRYSGSVKLPISFFLARITGLADGFVTLDYYNTHSISQYHIFRISDYFHNVLINGGGSSMRYFYTHAILGFPTTAVHSNSLPLAIGSLMYSGIWGYLFMALLFSLIFLWTERFIKKGLDPNAPSMILLYIGCYLAINSVGTLMGGGAESLIEIFTLPIMFSVTSLVFRN